MPPAFYMLWRSLLAAAALAGLHAPVASAGSRLLGTGGVMQLEGAAGGGLVPWAFVGGLGSREEIGGSAFCTEVSPQDFKLRTCGFAVGFYDRVEVSYARQRFDLGTTVPGESIDQDAFGVKWRVAGDAIFDWRSWMPQVAVGAQYKRNRDFDFVPQLLGAKHAEGLDLYVAATKVFLDGLAGRTVLVDATLRATKANQLGILGFGGDREDAYGFEPEFSAAMFLTDNVVVGGEYRFKPDNLSVFREDDFWDAFIAWIPHKALSLTLAYADLGNIADKAKQHGLYASLQCSL